MTIDEFEAFRDRVGGTYARHVLPLLRLAILVVMTYVVVSLIIAVARPETGPAEKVILGVAVVGLLVAARPVRRLGSGRA